MAVMVCVVGKLPKKYKKNPQKALELLLFLIKAHLTKDYCGNAILVHWEGPH